MYVVVVWCKYSSKLNKIAIDNENIIDLNNEYINFKSLCIRLSTTLNRLTCLLYMIVDRCLSSK